MSCPSVNPGRARVWRPLDGSWGIFYNPARLCGELCGPGGAKSAVPAVRAWGDQRPLAETEGSGNG